MNQKVGMVTVAAILDAFLKATRLVVWPESHCLGVKGSARVCAVGDDGIRLSCILGSRFLTLLTYLLWRFLDNKRFVENPTDWDMNLLFVTYLRGSPHVSLQVRLWGDLSLWHKLNVRGDFILLSYVHKLRECGFVQLSSSCWLTDLKLYPFA